MILVFLVRGNQRLSQDTANTLSVVLLGISTDVDITIVTPAGTPRVLDNESFIETNLFITNSQNSMIKISTASLSEDTGAVELEGVLIGFNEDRNRGIDEGSLQLVSGVGSDELVTSSDSNSLGFLVFARSVLGSVGVVRFSFETILGSIFNSEIRPATVASFILFSVTINDLLFRERNELAIVDEVETFEDTSGRESPA